MGVRSGQWAGGAVACKGRDGVPMGVWAGLQLRWTEGDRGQKREREGKEKERRR